MKNAISTLFTLLFMFDFLQSFGQIYNLSPKEFEDEVYVIGLFTNVHGLLNNNNEDSLYYYSDMKQRKYYAYEFGLGSDLGGGHFIKPICKGECHFFAYDNKLRRYYFYSDNIIGYTIPYSYHPIFLKKLRNGIKDFKVPKVNSETINDVISQVHNNMSKEYEKENAIYLENKRIKREKYVKDSTEKAKKDSITLEQERHKYRLTHNWHKNSIHKYIECMSCDESYDLDDCYLVTIDSNYCYYISNTPTIKMLGIAYNEVHCSNISNYIDESKVKEFFEIWKDTIANPTYNPKSTPQDIKGYNKQTFLTFCKKLKEKAPYGFIKDYGWNLNSVNGVEPSFEFFNTNDKTIKYVDFYFSIYNAVNDICYLDRNSTIGNIRGVGPVESFDSGSWVWNRATHYTSAAADHMKIVKLVLTYMDGSTKTLTGVQIVINTD